MNKKKPLVIIVFLSFFMLTNCIKAAKDIVDDIEARTRCIERLSDYTTDGSDKTCSQLTAEIDGILRDCGEFLSQEEKDDLNFAKDNCTDG